MAESEIVVRPNDRLLRGTLVIVGLIWWLPEGIIFKRQADPTGSLANIIWIAVIGALACFLIWLAIGRDVLIVRGGELRVERRIASFRIFQPRVYFLSAMVNLQVERRVLKIKGNSSTRYALGFNYATRKIDLLWRRRQSDADAIRMWLLTSIAGQVAGPRRQLDDSVRPARLE